MRRDLHILGVPHTIPHEDYLVCAFTAKILLFPDIIQPFGWSVVEYSNEGSCSNAREHIIILSTDHFCALSKRRSREEPFDIDVSNSLLKEQFQRINAGEIAGQGEAG